MSSINTQAYVCDQSKSDYNHVQQGNPTARRTFQCDTNVAQTFDATARLPISFLLAHPRALAPFEEVEVVPVQAFLRSKFVAHVLHNQTRGVPRTRETAFCLRFRGALARHKARWVELDKLVVGAALHDRGLHELVPNQHIRDARINRCRWR